MDPIQFTIYGEPVPQGSKKAVPIYKGGQPVMKDGRTLTRVVSDNPKLGQWRQQAAETARRHYTGEPISGAVVLTLVFVRPRPRSHYGSGKNANKLKPSAPAHPTSRPDTLKLARAIEDALTGVVWRDDSQIVSHLLRKCYGAAHMVIVGVATME